MPFLASTQNRTLAVSAWHIEFAPYAHLNFKIRNLADQICSQAFSPVNFLLLFSIDASSTSISQSVLALLLLRDFSCTSSVLPLFFVRVATHYSPGTFSSWGLLGCTRPCHRALRASWTLLTRLYTSLNDVICIILPPFDSSHASFSTWLLWNSAGANSHPLFAYRLEIFQLPCLSYPRILRVCASPHALIHDSSHTSFLLPSRSSLVLFLT